MSTLRDRKSAMKPSPKMRAMMRQAGAHRAARPASATYSGDPAPAAAMPARPVARTAAVAESAPTTRWRDEPKRAKASIGRRRVYSPVMTGIPAMFA